MRPIRLKIAGLNSFRQEETIDFRVLSEVGVFGIFGPTGSGKSSILDAITLALYGTVGRAERGTQGILNHAEKSLTVSFDFALGGGGERRYYRVERRYRRKDETSVQNAASRLIELDSEEKPIDVLADKAGEVTDHVIDLLGLKAEDFTRAVVLPQGKFQEFLHLKGTERKAMLQRLFGLEQYGSNLSKKLNNRYREVSDEHLRVQSTQEGLGDASQEALERAAAHVQEVERAQGAAREQLAVAQRLAKDAEQTREWQVELRAVEGLVAEHEARSEEVAGLKRTVETAERADRVWPLVALWGGAVEEQELRKVEKDAFSKENEQIAEELEGALRLLEAAKGEKEAREPELVAQQLKLEAAGELESLVDVLAGQVAGLEAEFARLGSELGQVSERIGLLTVEREAVRVRVEETERVLEANQVTPEFRNAVLEAKGKADDEARKSEEAREAAEQLRARQVELAAAEDEHAAAVTELEAVQSRLVLEPPCEEEELHRQEMELSSLRLTVGQLVEKAELLAVKEAEQVQATAVADAAETRYRTAQELVKSLRQQQTEMLVQDQQALAARLAEGLCAGDECPVCGAVEHPKLAVHVNTGSAVEDRAALEAEIAKAEREAEELQREVAVLSGQKVQLNTVVEGLRASVAELRAGVDSLTDLPEGEAMKAWVASEEQRIGAAREELRAWKVAREAVLAQQQELKVSLAASEQKRKAAGSETARAQTLFQEKEKVAREALLALQQELMVIGYLEIEMALADLQAREQAEQAAKERLKELDAQRKTLDEEWTAGREQEGALKVERKGIESTLVEQHKQLEEKQAKLHEVTAGRKVQEVLAEVTGALADLKQAMENAKVRYEQTVAAKADVEKKLTQAITLWEQSVALVEKRLAERDKKLAEERFATVGEVRDAQLLPDEMEEHKAALQAYQEQGRELSARRAGLLEKLQGRELFDAQWDEIARGLEQAAAAVEEVTSQFGAARRDYEELLQKHARWTELEEQRLALFRELSKLEELRKVLKGNDFVEFLAKEQLDYVARHASERLKQLTRNRYALETDAESGFVMRDDSNGGVKRPVTTLSGGETFLTSLSLALSLSSQIQLRGEHPLEFFFLDEGFGTLDPELLEVVMSTLEELNLGNMTIGVISHVPEMRQRMNRRLIVEPAEAAGRGSRVVIERA